ncbi:hypothetical protein KR054_007014, partial [Drosophila jambulina]
KYFIYRVLHLITIQISSKFEFTNINCKTLDPTFSEFRYCYIKPINRTYKYISLYAKLFQRNVTKINFSLFKRVNGYRPFMYNLTVDSCRFLRNTSSHPIADFFYNLIKSHSNLNHTCPYDHDIMIEILSIGFMNYKLTTILPFPEGQYLLETYWFAYDVPRAFVGFYGILS